MGVVNKFNRGEIDAIALARDDVERVNNSGSHVENFLPVPLGPMSLRPGTTFLGSTAFDNTSYMVPFVYAADDTAMIEFTSNVVRVWVDDAPIVRTAVTSTVYNPSFTIGLDGLDGWTVTEPTGTTAEVVLFLDHLYLTGTGTIGPTVHQTITTQTGVEHGFTASITQGPVEVMIGYSGVSSYEIFRGWLKPGHHHLAFTPTADVTITLTNSKDYAGVVVAVEFEGAGDLQLGGLGVFAADLPNLRYVQSADVIFFALKDHYQFAIERRGPKSWSAVQYQSDDGPFGSVNIDKSLTLKANGLNGDTTLSASRSYFTEDDIGMLFKLASNGQKVRGDVVTEDTGTTSIRVSGVAEARNFTVYGTGTWTATVHLQKSLDEGLSWEDEGSSWTTIFSVVIDPPASEDNVIVLYRLWVKTGNYTSGTVTIGLVYPRGSILGIGRVTKYYSSQSVGIQVLQPFGSTDYVFDWWPGVWSTRNGYPSAVTITEGRLWWAGKNKIWGSVSDAYYSYDIELEGESAAVQKTIGFGPVDNVSWMSGSINLVVGIASNEVSLRSTSFGEPLSSTNCTLKGTSSQGSALVDSVMIDDRLYFVQRAGSKLYEMNFEVGKDHYTPSDTNQLNPSMCQSGIVRIVVQRQPATRIWAVLSDGTCRVFTREPTEEVASWTRVTTNGSIVDMVMLPGSTEDSIYMIVSRTNGTFVEKIALESESQGNLSSNHFDSTVHYTSPGVSLTGLDHLTGATVGVWADGVDRGNFTVVTGVVTLPANSWVNVSAGLRYTGSYISNKVVGTSGRTILNKIKRIFNTALVLRRYVPGSINIGPDASSLSPMPATEGGQAVPAGLTNDYDEIPFDFDGDGETDPRFHIQATAPCTIMSLMYEVDDDELRKDKTPQQGGSR